MSNKVYSLANLSELVLEKSEITVTDKDTGEEKVVKTVRRAELAAIVAYMVGIGEKKLEEYYSHHYSYLLDNLKNDKAASIIRFLSKIRTSILKNFLDIDNQIRYSLKNLDSIEYFDAEEIKKLASWGIYVVQPNYRSEKYMIYITKLIEENIDACKSWFPESINFEYVRKLFVVPKYESEGVLKEEYNKFKGNKSLYPFQMYIYWEPEDQGYLFQSDERFLKVIYGQNGEAFYEGHKFRDAADDTKESIYNFIKESNRVVMVVDCENVDPYKLYGVLKNLKDEELSQVQRIILFDDYHTTIAWDYIGGLIDIPVEHVEVPRVTDAKSLVDIQMAVGVSAAYYRDKIDSFILCSSDSDFWGLISSITEARFLVMYEYNKCGDAIKDALTERSIFHCSMDDFYMENAGNLQEIVLKKTLESYLPNIIGENGWELTRRVYSDAYIYTSEKEMKKFYERYVANLKLKLDSNGDFYVSME